MSYRWKTGKYHKRDGDERRDEVGAKTADDVGEVRDDGEGVSVSETCGMCERDDCPCPNVALGEPAATGSVACERAGRLAALARAEKAEAERDEALADPRVLLSRIEMKPGSIEIDGRGWAVGALVSSFGELFRDSGAENNLTMAIHHAEFGPMTVTMQRESRPTPATQRDEARSERDEALARVAVLEAFVRAWEASRKNDMRGDAGASEWAPLSLRLEAARAAVGEVPGE